MCDSRRSFDPVPTHHPIMKRFMYLYEWKIRTNRPIDRSSARPPTFQHRNDSASKTRKYFAQKHLPRRNEQISTFLYTRAHTHTHSHILHTILYVQVNDVVANRQKSVNINQYMQLTGLLVYTSLQSNILHPLALFFSLCSLVLVCVCACSSKNSNVNADKICYLFTTRWLLHE